mgnify:CR=1 FL=1
MSAAAIATPATPLEVINAEKDMADHAGMDHMDGMDMDHTLPVKQKDYLLAVDEPLVVPTGTKIRLLLTSNDVIHAWSVPALLVTILYPFTKRFFAMPQAFLGIAFNFGIVIAFAAVRGEVPATAWVLWLANLFLVLAYDTEYAMVDRDDDLKIGMKTSAITLGRFDVAGIMVFFALCLALTAWALWPLVPGWPLALGLGAAAAQVAWHYTLIRGRTRAGCFTAFSKSHWIGVALFAGVALGYALR